MDGVLNAVLGGKKGKMTCSFALMRALSGRIKKEKCETTSEDIMWMLNLNRRIQYCQHRWEFNDESDSLDYEIFYDFIVSKLFLFFKILLKILKIIEYY